MWIWPLRVLSALVLVTSGKLEFFFLNILHWTVDRWVQHFLFFQEKSKWWWKMKINDQTQLYFAAITYGSSNYILPLEDVLWTRSDDNYDLSSCYILMIISDQGEVHWRTWKELASTHEKNAFDVHILLMSTSSNQKNNLIWSLSFQFKGNKKNSIYIKI